MLPAHPGKHSLTVSFIVEWANTTYNGVPRFIGLLDILTRQWQELIEEQYPDDLEEDERRFLQRIKPEAELLIVSGEAIEHGVAEEIRQRCIAQLVPAIHVREGLEYYALKNYGADLAQGDIICFLDCDIYPDAGWLAYLLGTFANPQIRGVAGKPYVAPIDLFSRAFALGWTYDLPDRDGPLVCGTKYYTNNVAFVRALFDQYRFPPLDRRTRGAASALGKQLSRDGYPVWENRKARVDHPAPSGWKHLAVRALAHGRDIYMKSSEERSWKGLSFCQKTAGFRLWRGFRRTCRHWREVGLEPLEIAPTLLIIFSYYGLFSLGGLLTHISPEFMGRRFRL